MQKVWREVTLLTVGAAVVTVALLVSGCSVSKSESSNSVAVALGGANTAGTKVDTHQNECQSTGGANVLKALVKRN